MRLRRTSFLLAAACLAAFGAGTLPVHAGAAPTFRIYSVGIKGGEPSIGWDPLRKAALYGAGLKVRRLTWDAHGFHAQAADAPTAVTSLDAITMVDQTTGRSFNSQLAGACSLTSFSDDGGASWTPSQGCGLATLLDHQSLGAGPFHSPVAATPVGPDAVYYCAQNGYSASCAVSFDGGVTFGPGSPTQNTPANDPNDPDSQIAAEGGACSALHGHLRVAPDGTAFLPLKGCGGQPTIENGTNSEFYGGRPALSISSDNGLTWRIHEVPAATVPDGRGGTNAVENPDEADPSVAIAKDGTVYFGWENGHNPSDFRNGDRTQAMIAVSRDDGTSWSKPVDVSSALGLKNVMFPEVIAGDGDRAAIAFLGTADVGDDQTNAFPKDKPWYLYVAVTYDRGKTWTTVNGTPRDPVQRGCIDMQGTTIPPSDRADICKQRNLLDFNDITVDSDGRVLVAYSDGCEGACTQSATGSSGNVDKVLRMESGPLLYSRPAPAAAGGVQGVADETPLTRGEPLEPPLLPLAMLLAGLAALGAGALLARRR